MQHPFFKTSERVKIFAHRGYLSQSDTGKGLKENTVPAFSGALRAGTNFIETDCQVTKDSEVVLFHDPDLKRLLGDERSVKNISLAELRETMDPYGGVLTLREALEMFPETRFNVDVKSGAGAALIGDVVAPHTERVLLTSFSEKRRKIAMREVAKSLGADQKMPATSGGFGLTVSLILANRLSNFSLMKKLLKSVDALQIPETLGRLKILDRRILAAAKQSGVEVHVWTVNDQPSLERLLNFGVDGIVTDEAALALRLSNQVILSS